MEYKNNMFYIYNKRENIISCIKGKSKFVEWLNKKADNFTYQFFTTLKEFEKWEKNNCERSMEKWQTDTRLEEN